MLSYKYYYLNKQVITQQANKFCLKDIKINYFECFCFDLVQYSGTP